MSRKTDYFEYFIEIADIACKQAEHLHNTFSNYDPAKLTESRDVMHHMEHTADEKKADMIEQLIKEFLPPFDRDDIISLAELYDTVCDTVDDVLLKFYMYGIDECTPQAIVISGKIVEICHKLYDLTCELRGFKKQEHLITLVEAVNDGESEGDALYSDAMHELFSKETDPKTLIIWRDLYTALEDCFDSCEVTADLIRNIIIKNS